MRVLAIDPGLKHLSLCLLEGSNIVTWEVLDLLEGGGTKKMPSVEQTLYSLIRQIDALGPPEVDVVLVEKQPNTNARMRVIESSLVTYFKCRGTAAEVKAYSPRYKLKGQTAATTYAARKTLAVKLVKEVLSSGTVQTSDELRQTFEDSKKKDDRADCLLMCLHYTKMHVPCFESKTA